MDATTQTTTDFASKTLPMVIHGRKTIEVNHICHLPRTVHRDTRARKKIIITCILCVMLMVCEIIAGIFSNSLSLVLDATHLLLDFAGFMIALFAIWLASRPPSQRFNFGWYRAEVIGALYVVVIIWFMSASLGYLAVRRIIKGEYDVNGKIMIIVGSLSVVVNLIMGLQLRYNIDIEFHQLVRKHRLSRFKRSYNMGHMRHTRDRLYTKLTAEKQVQTPKSWNVNVDENLPAAELSTETLPQNKFESTAVRVAFVNAMGDLLQSLAVLLAGIIIYIRPDWGIADPILTFIFIILVVITTFGILREALLTLMESTPSYMEYDEVVSEFLSIKGVQGVHNLHIWALNMNKVACVAHLDIEPDADPAEILREANTVIHRRYKFFETTIQIDQ